MKAVELLEPSGRGVFWSERARLRSSLDLGVSGPAEKTLVDRFTHAISFKRNALISPCANVEL